jgi:hypothetical protein
VERSDNKSGTDQEPKDGRAYVDAILASRQSVLNYVPDNLLLVIKLPADVVDSVDPSVAASVARNFVPSLNDRILTYLKRLPLITRPPANASLPELVAFDLKPAVLADFVRRNPGFAPLHDVAADRPALILDWPDRPASLFACYQIDPKPARDAGTPEQDLVRELVNIVNSGMNDDERQLGRATIEKASPNWHAATAGNTCHGPGGQPQAANPGSIPRMIFPDPPNGPSQARKIVRAARETKPNQVVIAVLDTCPDRPTLRQQRDAIKPGPRWPGWLNGAISDPNFTKQNWKPSRLDQIWIDEDGLSVPEAAILSLLQASGQPIVPNPYQVSGQPQSFFLAPDHGLFVAGIVKDVAPRAEVHLLRVLDDYGVGDTTILAVTLYKLGRKYAEDKRPLVVNLSLVEDRPIGPHAQALWFPLAFQALLWDTYVRLLSTNPNDPLVNQLTTTLAQLNYPLEKVIDWLYLKVNHVLIVAAAGNDGNLRPMIPIEQRAPRSPADYESVLAAAALTRQAHASDYSNEGDPMGPLDNGVSIWAGNAAPTAISAFPVIESSGSPASLDGVIGIFCSSDLPYGGGKNQTGWGYWAGTSFAAPAISALAACLWMTPYRWRSTGDPFPTGSDVLKFVRSSLINTAPGAMPPSLQAPPIPADQQDGRS